MRAKSIDRVVQNNSRRNNNINIILQNKNIYDNKDKDKNNKNETTIKTYNNVSRHIIMFQDQTLMLAIQIVIVIVIVIIILFKEKILQIIHLL